MPDLHYEPRADARPVVVERDGAVTRVVVHMRGLYVPVPSWVHDLDVLALVVGPLWWVGSLLVRVLLRLPKPPRAVFEVTREHLRMTLRDRASGETSDFAWPKAAVVEARVNRFEPGLWLNVTGHVKDTYLQDLPRESLERVEEELRAALTSAPKAPTVGD
jgi:hypothetical protein